MKTSITTALIAIFALLIGQVLTSCASFEGALGKTVIDQSGCILSPVEQDDGSVYHLGYCPASKLVIAQWTSADELTWRATWSREEGDARLLYRPDPQTPWIIFEDTAPVSPEPVPPGVPAPASK